LGSFAAPGSQPLAKGKPAKPFGAPDSDAEDDGSDEEAEGDSQPDEGRAASPEKESEEKKKLKLQKGRIEPSNTY
jgi:DEAD/DEAH box helicase domain-containing protein